MAIAGSCVGSEMKNKTGDSVVSGHLSEAERECAGVQVTVKSDVSGTGGKEQNEY